MNRSKYTLMVGKLVDYQNPNNAEQGKNRVTIMDKIISSGINYYIISEPDGTVQSIPCFWIIKIHN